MKLTPGPEEKERTKKIQVLWLLSSHASFISFVANDRRRERREIERERERERERL